MKWLAIIYTVLIFISSKAQSQTDYYGFGLRITSVEKKGDRYFAKIEHGNDIGIVAGGKGNAYGIKRSDINNHNKKIGTVVIDEVLEQSSLAEITPIESDQILAGDLVYINIQASTSWHSTYFYLIQNAIEIVNDNSTPYYSLTEILQRDGHALRTEKFLAMQQDIRLEGERLKKSGNKSAVEAGPNKGRFVHEVMMTTDTLAVWFYLYHISQLDWDYLGQTIQLSRSYYDYAKEGDAATSPVLKDLFVSISPEKRQKNFEDYKRKINLQLIKDWLKDANDLIDKKNYEDALALLDASVFLAEKIGENDQLGVNAFRMGEVYDYQTQYNESLAAYKKSKQAFEKSNNKEYLAFALHKIARSYYNLKDYSSAEDKFQPALILRRELAHASTDRSDLYYQLYQLLDDYGSNFLARNNYQGAEAIYQEALGAAQKSGEKIKEGDALWNLGYTEFNGELNFQQAAKNYVAAIDIFVSLHDTSSLQQLYKNTGKVYAKLNQFDKALEKYKARLSYLRDDNLDKKSDALWDIGYALTELNQYAKSNEYYQQVKKIYIQMGDTTDLCTILNNMGFNYRDLNDSINAYRVHQEAIALAKHKHDDDLLAKCYNKISSTYNHFKNKSKRIEYLSLERQLQIKLNNNQKIAETFENQGDAYADLTKYDLASKSFMQAMAYYEKAKNLDKQAEMYWDYAYQLNNGSKDYDESIRAYRIAYGLYMQNGDSVNASTMLSNVGQNYWSKLDYQKAIESHKAAIDLAKKCKNQKQVASSWSKLSTLYSESNNPVASVEALENAVDALTTVNDSTMLASTYKDLASSYSKSKNYTKAFEFLNKSIAIRKALKDTLSYATGIYTRGSFYHNKNDYKLAAQDYKDALTIQRKIKDKNGIIYTLTNLGVIQQSVDNDYITAEKTFLEALRLSQEMNDDYNLGYVYARMKTLYRSQGKKQQAEQALQKEMEVYKHGKLWKEVGYALVDMGYDASYVDGSTKKSMEYLDQAQIVADTVKDTFLQANIYGARSSVLRDMAEFNEALNYANKGLALYTKLDNQWGVAGAYIDKGNIFKQLSEYDSAILCQQMADSIYKSIGSEYARLAPLANLGECMTSEGNYNKGLEFYKQSYAIMQKAHDLNENLGIILGCIGESYLYLNNYPESEKWLKESLVVCDKVGAMRPKAENLGVMGRLKLEEKRYDEAFPYLNEGLKLSKEKSLRIAYLNNVMLMGRLEAERKNYPKAKPFLEECIKLSHETNKASTLWESLYWLGIVYKNNKQLPESKKYLKEAVETIEKIRNKVSGGEEARKMFSSDKNILNAYEALVDVLLQLGETDVAMSYLQKNNEDNLKAKFKDLDIKFEDKDKEQAVTQERTMKAKLDGIEQQLANEKSLPIEKQNLEKIRNLEGIKTVAESDYLKFVNLQVNVRPELTKYFNNSVQPINFKNEKRYIPKDMALLSYLPGETQLYIFIATHDTVIAKVIDVGREQLSKDINAMLNIVRSNLGTFAPVTIETEKTEREELVAEIKQTDKMLRPFEEMYHYLIAPASAEIASKKRLGIIPTGVINYIPFQMLGKTLRSGKFSLLINQFSIFYMNSTRVLSMPDDASKEYNIIAFGNPDKTLPSTEKEVGDIKKIYPSASVYLREEATEDKAKYAPEQYNVMHFATHGNLDYEDFTQSFLTMAGNPTKKEDGKLTLEELWGMDVMSHLNIVVLSACQTAVTKGSNESSPVSPASGFLQNGVKSVVATLWKVDDEATSLLIADFYKNIKTMNAADALRMAQINLSKNPKFSHPYYWAAEILMGDWR